MRLDEYLNTLHIDPKAFANAIGVSERTIRNVMAGKKDFYLSTALKIEKQTIGAVKCKDLAPENFKL